MRLNRLTETVKTVQRQEASDKVIGVHNLKSFDCTECGICFLNVEVLEAHNDISHNKETNSN